MPSHCPMSTKCGQSDDNACGMKITSDTDWMPLSEWPETLESQEIHARIMPLRSIYLGNPGLEAVALLP